MNKIILLLAILLPFAIYAQYDFTLEQAVNYGLQNSKTFKNAQLESAKQKEFAFEIMTEGFPKLKANLDYNYAFQQQTSVIPAGVFSPQEMVIKFSQPQSATLKAELNQLIFDARYVYGLKARKVLLQIADQQVEQARIDITEDITKAYYAALISQKAYTLLLENKTTLEEILRDTRATYNVGLIDELSVDRLELNLQNLESEITKLHNQYDLALNNLKFSIGMPQEEELIVTEKLDDITSLDNVPILQDIDPNERIEAKLLDNRLEMKKFDIKQVRSNYFPALYAFGNYGTNAQRTKFDFFDTNQRWFDFGNLGFSLQIPLFDGLKAYSQIQQKKIEEQMTLNDRENFNEAVQLQFSNAQTQLINAINEYNNQKQNLALANKILNKTRVMFNEGVGSSYELSQAQQEYTTTMINYSQSVYNLLIAKLELEKVSAKL
ncbi:MAG: TolC family protein [Chitinophagales bacterium]|nr:TolC family protein [Chitinophagales bacterium]